MGNNFYGNNNNRKRKWQCLCKEIKEIGLILVIFGIVSICAFFLPPKAFILLLAAVLVFCGVQLLK